MTNRIENIRTYAGESQKQFADKIGVSIELVQAWENKKLIVDFSCAQKIAQIYGYELPFIYGYTFKTKTPERQWEKTIKDDYKSLDCVLKDCFLHQNFQLVYERDFDEQEIIHKLRQENNSINVVSRNGSVHDYKCTDEKLDRILAILNEKG